MFAVRVFTAAFPVLALASCGREAGETALDLGLTLTGGSIDRVEIQNAPIDSDRVDLQRRTDEDSQPSARLAERRSAGAVVRGQPRWKNSRR